MTELVIESVPSGGRVYMGSRYVGRTPMTYSVDTKVDLKGFRDENLSGGHVVCTREVLKSRLEDKTISRLWWLLTEQERRSIAEHAAMDTFPRAIPYKRKGNPNCRGGVGEWGEATCVPNSIIRCLKIFGNPAPSESDADQCYWKDYSGDENCFFQNDPYNLPCHTVSCLSDDRSFCHALAAIQVNLDTSSLNSWCIFQYTKFDLKPGDYQLPYGSTISIYAPYNLKCGSSYGTLMHRLKI